MTPDLPAPLSDVLLLQCGVVSRQQAASAGMTASAIDNKLRSKRWRNMQRGVYYTFSGATDREADLWAVTLRAGPRSALSYRTAAELYGLDRPSSGPIHVTVPVHQAAGPIKGAVVHRSRLIDPARHPMLLPPRTRVEDTVLDLTQIATSFDEAFDWLCKAIGRRLTTAERLRAALRARPRARFRAELILALADLADGVRSQLERKYVSKVERPHGLPRARRQAKVLTAGQARYIDNLYDQAKLAVELDGRASHPPEQRWADSHRDNAHASVGILTLRYNWSDITNRPCLVAAEIASLIQARGVDVTPRRCGANCSV